MDIFLWLIVIAAFVLGFAGIIYPVLPSVLMFWVGFLVYNFFIGDELSWMFWVIAASLTVVALISDVAANSYFVKKFGGSKKGELAAIIGAVIGMFIYPPFGVLFVPFVFVFVVEFIQIKDMNKALKASIGSFLAFIYSAVFDIIVYIFLIMFFLLDVFLYYLIKCPAHVSGAFLYECCEIQRQNNPIFADAQKYPAIKMSDYRALSSYYFTAFKNASLSSVAASSPSSSRILRTLYISYCGSCFPS